MTKLSALILLILLVTGCMSKSTGICLEYLKDGHGQIRGSAGPWGEVLDISMDGPSRFSKVEKDATTHPCVNAPLTVEGE
jgi:hypothetical protein